MNQLEMLQKMFENPKRKATSSHTTEYNLIFQFGVLMWVDKYNKHISDYTVIDHDKWDYTVHEPEPAKVDTLTAFKAFTHGKAIMSFKQKRIYCESRYDCRGCINSSIDVSDNLCNNHDLDNITEEEINDNEWIILG